MEKLKLNKKRGLLERQEHDFILKNPEEPELYRYLFSYDEIPKIAFNDRKVPMITPDEWWITDTSFRD